MTMPLVKTLPAAKCDGFFGGDACTLQDERTGKQVAFAFWKACSAIETHLLSWSAATGPKASADNEVILRRSIAVLITMALATVQADGDAASRKRRRVADDTARSCRGTHP
ncbi:hypothetical protein [Xanthomonas fragariae]|uniref:hypothetical protein n=1 Tax=Xanthomonas fragariae TaxID=48664 RepID=UPI001ABDF261|nr:hypothetical protein [Xanthomonas fragariae]UKR51942.1 hypothetical protein K4A87_14730 [Xanthomonas fragariae]